VILSLKAGSPFDEIEGIEDIEEVINERFFKKNYRIFCHTKRQPEYVM
ncbi:hypothetical protein D1BOALGB6SA_3267, partial [Olavius sp. associated proteobacterium Delta 1]